MVEKRCTVQREEVYRWFSRLSSARRAEFLCGLLDLCVPIELRFLGSCLEDLARKDYHSLRDAEIKANNPADLAGLTNITDEVVRSKLLVSLALLGSDNREAAGVLFRTLTHTDAVINNYGLRLNDGRTGDQFLLLFTMASNHPAFSFHQKQVLREELAQIRGVLAGGGGGGGGGAAGRDPDPSPVAVGSCYAGCPGCQKVTHQDDGAGRGDEGSCLDPFPPMATHSCPEPPVRVHAGKSGKVSIERVDLRGAPQKNDKQAEYLFEVLWSDCSLSTVSRTAQEVAEFLHKISQLFPDDGLDKFLPRPPCLDSALEAEARCLAGLPPHLLKRDQIRQFFSPAPGGQFPPTAGHGCSLQYRGAGSLARPVCGVASIQPVISAHCSLQPYPAAPVPPPAAPPAPAPAPPVPEAPPALPPPPPGRSPAPQPPATAATTTGGEQNGILDWLRKLRLHKYYPVFKQLTMEKFLALTEEDLNKYDLTQGAKKKLKTQLELQNREKSEKRYALTQFPASCSGGVARVTPSSHVGPVAPVHPGAGTELRVEVPDAAPPSFPRDSGSSSGYSSSPSSPPAPLCRDDAFDRARELHRPPPGLDPGEKVIRPTAQVLPVQTDASSSPYHLPLLSPRKPRPPPAGSRVESRLAASAAVASAELPPAPDVAATPTRYVAPRPGGVVGGSADAGGDAGSEPGAASPCGSCGCAGGCGGGGAYAALPAGYAGYFPHPFPGPPVLTLGPLLHLGPLLPGPHNHPHYPPPAANATATLYDGRPAGGFVLPPVPVGVPVGVGVYQAPQGLLGGGGGGVGGGGAGGAGPRKSGNVSCYNCGVSGHRAQECKQPPMDAAQQGTFRLKYAPPSDGQDSGD